MNSQQENQIAPATEAWVIFTGKTDLPWLRLLKPGFRHCYVVLNDGKSWFSLDPMSHRMDIAVHHHIPVDFNLPLWLRDRGHVIARAYMHNDSREAPWMPLTCVEAVKRVIGVRSRRILTPWQLYRHLINQSTNLIRKKGEFAWEV